MMNTIIFLMGPTASGKTDLVIELYQKHPVEIISVDSALIYKEMNIGTAKPTQEVLQKFPHQLVDIIYPNEEYSVKSFVNDALESIKKAHDEKKIPVLVGGTSFYFHALEYGLSELPESTPESRAWVNERIDSLGLEGAYHYLQEIDSQSATHLHANDSQRVSRALEVYHLSGEPLSSLQGNKQGYLKQHLPEHQLHKFALMPDKSVLDERIQKRFHTMIEAGLVNEVRRIVETYHLDFSYPALRAVGYKQIWQYLSGEVSLDEATLKGIIATRQLAKKQRTWLRSMEQVTYVTDSSEMLELLEHI